MKRYFIVHEDELPTAEINEGRHFGGWHSIDLGSHGGDQGFYAVVLCDEHVQAPRTWQQLPHLLERTPLEKTHVDHLGPVGVKHWHTAYDAAAQLATIHPLFRP